jgi:hypothetical protein
VSASWGYVAPEPLPGVVAAPRKLFFNAEDVIAARALVAGDAVVFLVRLSAVSATSQKYAFLLFFKFINALKNQIKISKMFSPFLPICHRSISTRAPASRRVRLIWPTVRPPSRRGLVRRPPRLPLLLPLLPHHRSRTRRPPLRPLRLIFRHLRRPRPALTRIRILTPVPAPGPASALAGCRVWSATIFATEWQRSTRTESTSSNQWYENRNNSNLDISLSHSPVCRNSMDPNNSSLVF